MADPANTGIYEIVNLVNGKRYVGSAVSVHQRWREHRGMLKRGTHHSRHLQNAWMKYGGEAFAWRLLAVCLPHELLSFEQCEFEKSVPAYNVCRTAGSTLGRLHSEETKRKIAEAHVGSKMPTRSAEHRAKLSAAHKGKLKSSEQMAALQEGRRKYVRSDADRKQVTESLIRSYQEGRHRRDRPPEYREKISAGLRGRSLSEQHRENLSRAMSGKKRGLYKLDPTKAEARREAGRKLAAFINAKRWGVSG